MICIVYSINQFEPLSRAGVKNIKKQLGGRDAEIRRILQGSKHGDIVNIIPASRLNTKVLDNNHDMILARRVNGKRVKYASQCAFLLANFRDENDEPVGRSRYYIDISRLPKRWKVRELMDYIVDKEA